MRSVLIVEDEEILRDTYQIILSSEPYKIAIARDGEDALNLVREESFDLILLDIMMPRMDGVAFLQACKDKGIKLPGVVVLSNLSSGEQLEQVVKLGARRTAVKAELSPKQLISLVKYELQAQPTEA